MAKPFYITTPIYYVNSKPHLGHAYTTIIADVAARFHSLSDADTFFLTGTDEHGDKIVRAATEQNITPQSYADMISSLFKSLWPELNIRNNAFIRTTDPSHIAVVRQILQKIFDSGDIYFSEYEGLYCFDCERFYSPRELEDGKCPDHEKKPEIIKETNYFFKMSRYQDWLINHIKDNPGFIRPERYKNEVLAFLREPLDDLCISRPKTRLEWGITLPFDKDYVTYVWFDALINYISALGYPDGDRFKKYWPVAQHIVAKDILKPHGIYWPIMLKAAGIPIYRHLNVHGYWNIDQSKMSKSLGNVVDPLQLKDKYGVDAFRFFLMRDMVFGRDSNFNETALIERINADLANDLGNLFSRVITMTHKYFFGYVPSTDSETEQEMAPGLQQYARSAVEKYIDAMGAFEFHKGLAAIWEFINHSNKYIDHTTPWNLAKEPSKKKLLAYVIYNLLEGLRIISGLIWPIMPMTAIKMQEHLGMGSVDHSHLPLLNYNQLLSWKELPAGVQIKPTIALFPRIEVKKDTPQSSKNPKKQLSVEKLKTKPPIDHELFSKIDLRVATVLAAKKVPKSKKLLQLKVDCGEKRSVIAGIAASYTPDDLIGKQIILVANLKPAKIMGHLSQGMLIAAIDGDISTVAAPDQPMKPGTALS